MESSDKGEDAEGAALQKMPCFDRNKRACER